jgi:hypothetical protein
VLGRRSHKSKAKGRGTEDNIPATILPITQTLQTTGWMDAGLEDEEGAAGGKKYFYYY